MHPDEVLAWDAKIARIAVPNRDGVPPKWFSVGVGIVFGVMIASLGVRVEREPCYYPIAFRWAPLSGLAPQARVKVFIAAMETPVYQTEGTAKGMDGMVLVLNGTIFSVCCVLGALAGVWAHRGLTKQEREERLWYQRFRR